MDLDRDWYPEERIQSDIRDLMDMLAQAGDPSAEEEERHVRAIRQLLDERRQMLTTLLDEQ